MNAFETVVQNIQNLATTVKSQLNKVYDMFYDTTAKDVTIKKIKDNDTGTEDVTVPNLAKIKAEFEEWKTNALQGFEEWKETVINNMKPKVAPLHLKPKMSLTINNVPTEVYSLENSQIQGLKQGVDAKFRISGIIRSIEQNANDAVCYSVYADIEWQNNQVSVTQLFTGNNDPYFRPILAEVEDSSVFTGIQGDRFLAVTLQLPSSMNLLGYSINAAKLVI